MNHLKKLIFYMILAFITLNTYCAAVDFTSINNAKCNVQTTIDFSFNSDTTIDTNGALNNGHLSKLKFLDTHGNDLDLSLTNFELHKFPTNNTIYKPIGIYNQINSTINGAFVMKFASGINQVYVYIPFTQSLTNGNLNPDKIAKEQISIFQSVSATRSLSVFNILGRTDYNVWFSGNSGQDTILAYNFIVQQQNTSSSIVPITNTLLQQLDAQTFSGFIRLCYASSNNFQTHLRESYPLWFFWISFFVFWLFYLFSNSTTLNVYHKDFSENKWTCWSIYSLFSIAHQDFFTRLSRLTVLYINVILQGLIAGCIMGNVQTGAAMIIWVAAIAFVGTIPFPFIFGQVFFKNIYETNIKKFQSIKKMIGVLDKTQLLPHQQAIDEAQQKLFSYYHWFYSIFFVIFFVCIPITINQMQRLSRVNYQYHYYWIASVFISFVLQHFILGPILAGAFGNSQIVRNRGGYFYPIKMAQSYRQAQIA